MELRRALRPRVLLAAGLCVSPTYAEGKSPSASNFARKSIAAW